MTTKATNGRKGRGRLSVGAVIAQLARDTSGHLSGVFGVLHEIKSQLVEIRTKLTPASPLPGERFKAATSVRHWKISKPNTVPPAYLAEGDRVIDEPAELAVVLHEIAVRADTIGLAGRIAVLTFNADTGRLELWARERIT